LKYYLAIDQGTHASRACLFDETGRMVSEHTKTIQLKRISRFNIEQDADEIVNSVKEVVAKLLQEVSTQHTIVACGIAIQRSSVVAWQNDGTAISPVLSWQDTRGAQQMEHLRKVESEIQQLSGLPLSAHYGATKLHYLLNNSLNKASSQNISTDRLRLSPLISYLLFHILEEHPYIVDHANAQRTQLFDLATLNWSTRLATLFSVPLQTLPVCVPVLNHTDTTHGKLVGTEIPVTAISGDQNAAIFGAGSLTPETALVNFGSGAFVLSLLTHYQASKKQLSTIACSDHNTVEYVREGTINGAASALSWLEKKHNVNDLWKQLPAWLNEVSRNETGLNESKQPPLFINAIGGLGSPWWNNKIEAKFIIADSSSHKSKAGLAAIDLAASDLPSQAVAVIESIVFMVCINLKLMQMEQTLNRLRVCGGLSQLDGLCQDLADLSGIPVERMLLPEATARGIAWLAAGKPDDWSKVEVEVFESANNSALRERYAMFSATLNDLL
jgi:glycerol kinase